MRAHLAESPWSAAILAVESGETADVVGYAPSPSAGTGRVTGGKEPAVAEPALSPGADVQPTEDGSTTPPGRRARIAARLPRYAWTGTLVALLMGCSTCTPSLLPRSAILQGLVAGIAAAFGYGVGETIAWAVRRITHWEPSAASASYGVAGARRGRRRARACLAHRRLALAA